MLMMRHGLKESCHGLKPEAPKSPASRGRKTGIGPRGPIVAVRFCKFHVALLPVFRCLLRFVGFCYDPRKVRFRIFLMRFLAQVPLGLQLFKLFVYYCTSFCNR